jgi:hypothetical protein
MFNHLGYHPQGVGKRRVGLCAKVKPQVKALFARCGGNIPTTLDDAQVFNSFPDIHVFNDVINNKSLGLLIILLLWAPKQMAHNVIQCLRLTWTIPFICQTFPLAPFDK